jgi:serine/threonine-protein kinase
MSSESEAPRIPGYRIEGVLGRGATGVVYRARQVSVDRVVALKVLHRELVGARRAEQRLQREARTTARLAHPNIISAIDMGEVGGVWWYAMELVDGVSLQDRLRDGALSEREALRLFIPLVEALQHAFERGVVHRDIKPGNILVEKGGRARLVDLGLAVADDDPLLTKGGGTLGTPHYISPEQARDPRSADVQSDLWSFGATLYHAVCGRPPFEGESVAEILSAVLYARIADPLQHAPYLSRGFALVLRKCLTRDRANRYATPAELLADLERVRERRSPNVAKSRLDPVVKDWRPVRKPAIVAAALVAAVLLGWAAVATFGRGTKPDPAAADLPKAPDPVRGFENAVDGPVDRLTGALAAAALLESSGAVPAGSQGRLAESKRRLERRIADEVESFERAADATFEASLAARDFPACERQVEGGFAADLAARLGPARLPDSIQSGFDAWTRARGGRLAEAREAALAGLGPALGAHVKGTTLPKVDDLLAHGDWKSARELLTFDPGRFARDAGIPLAGLSDADVARATESVRAVVAERRARLDEAWAKLDGELGAWVEGRVGALRDALVDRTQRDAPARLRADWERELGSRGLSVEKMPIGVARTANEAVARGEQTLGEVERKVADEDAHLRLAELEAAAAPLWRERRYAEIEKLYGDAGGESWSAAFKDRVELPELEAHRLEGLLQRAAEGVQKKKGEAVTLQLGTLAFTGRLVATPDPLVHGFGIRPERGQELAFALRGPSTTPQLLPGPALEALAGLARLDAAGPSDRVLVALFRWREAEPGSAEAARAAQAALDSGPTAPDDPLRGELERRIATALAGAEKPETQNRAHAVEKLRLLRRETAGREKKLGRIEDLLKQYSGDLSSEELAEVRNLRAELTLEGTPSKLADFVEAFRLPADRIELSPPPKVRATLRFEFAEGRPTGTFERGEWTADREGWIADRPARSDEEMLARAAPTLVLRDPLRVQKETFEIVLRFEQPGDAPPNLLLISAAGIQVALVGTRRPRCLVRTGDAAAAVAHAREDDGKLFEGLDRGATYEMRIGLNRSGKAAVDLRKIGVGKSPVEGEWKRVADAIPLASRGDEKELALTIRSFETVRLLSVTIDAARR